MQLGYIYVIADDEVHMKLTGIFLANLHIHDAVQVEACRSGMLYLVNVVGKDGSVLSEVAFNSQTGCFGANTVQVLSSDRVP